MPNQQPTLGIFIGSHRMATQGYVPVPNIPTDVRGEQLLENFVGELRSRWQGGYTGRSPQLALKEGLLSVAVFGGTGNPNIRNRSDIRDLWEGYQQILRSVMPSPLKFRRLVIETPEIIVETAGGSFIIDESSGGLWALIEITWQIFLRSWRQPSFTALIDEPENHLHPSLQQEVMPNLLIAFPHVQFIVATHSPLVVTAERDATVWAFDFNDGGRVVNRLLDYREKAATADETLHRVLGMASTLPIWAERQFTSIIARYAGGSLTTESVRSLRDELRANGLLAEFPDALLEISERSDGEAQL